MGTTAVTPGIEIKELIEDLFTCLNANDSGKLKELFHPKATFANIGNANDLFIRSIKEYLKTTEEAIKKHNIKVENKLEEITHLQMIDEVIASVELRYTMIVN